MKSYIIKSIYVQDGFVDIWEEFEKIVKENGEIKSKVINTLIAEYVKNVNSKNTNVEVQ